MAGDKSLDKQFISEYARREELSPKEAERQIQAMIEVMRDVLMLTSRIRLRRFGEFYLSDRKNARIFNKVTEMMERIPMIKVIKFRPSRSLKQELNNKTKDNLLSRFRQ